MAPGIVIALLFAGILGQRSATSMLASAAGWAGGLWFAAWFVPRLGMPFHETPVDWSMAHLVAGIIIAIAWTVPTALAGLPTALRPGRGDPERPLVPATA